MLLILFGSYAKGNYTAASDVDILVVYDGKREEAYKIVKKLLNIPNLEPHVYTKRQYEEIKDTIEKIGIPAVILFGIPSYKDEIGSAAYDKNGVVQKAVSAIKEAFGNEMHHRCW